MKCSRMRDKLACGANRSNGPVHIHRDYFMPRCVFVYLTLSCEKKAVSLLIE